MDVPITADSATVHIILELPPDPVKRGELLSLLVELGTDNLKITGSGGVEFELYGKAGECFEKWQRIVQAEDDS